jgi:signal transduction histidine kinase
LIRHLLPWITPQATAADEAALDHHLDEMAIFYGASCAIALNLLHLIFWPTDRLLLPGDPHVQGVMSWFRATTFTNHALFLVAMMVPALRRFPRPLFGLCALVSSALFGSAMARLGSLDQPYFYLTYLAPMGISALPTRPWARLSLSPACAGVLCLSYFVTSPQQLASPRFGSALGGMAFAVAVSQAIGQGMYLLTRRAFLSERALAHSRETLQAYSERLEERVEDYGRQLRRLAAHLSRAAEEERARLARELHDEVGQQITALRFVLQAARLRGGPELALHLSRIEEGLAQLASGVRDLVTDLRPRVLDDRGLGPAVRWLVERTAERTGLRCTLSLEEAPAASASREQSIAVFRIVQESLTNALRHARASAVEVRLQLGADAIRASVRDDGCGMEAVDMNRTGMGIFGMSERARALGGRLEVESRPGAGTVVRLELPLR